MKERTKYLLEILLVVFLFVSLSYFVQTNLEAIKNTIGTGPGSMLLYLFITTIAVVVAPISATPLLPLASNLWGWFLASILSIIGWTFGAYIAFFLARRYGVRIVRKFLPMERIMKIESRIPDTNLFWSVVFLRVVLPVDLLSYALGLFSKIKTKDYILATILGVTPFAFVFAYIGKLPFYSQIIILSISLIILILGYLTKRTIDKRKGLKLKNLKETKQKHL